MKIRAPGTFVLVILISLALAIPPDVASQAGQRAGQVSRLIPAVNVQRGAQQLTAAAHMPVFWEDVVRTQRMARARIDLDDGSILNVGAESGLRITKHDPGAQQTELELTYGRLRSKAVRIARPDGKFEVRTPAGVAGVVGTDFYILYANAIMMLIVFEGKVRFCNLSGQCVDVLAGMVSSIRGNQKPDPPIPATPAQLTEAVQSTDLPEPPAAAAPQHVNPWLVVGLVGLVAAPAIAIAVATQNKRPPPGGQPCVPTQTRVCP